MQCVPQELERMCQSKNVFSAAQGDLYVDGSCSWGTHPEAARAGWAAVQLDDDGQVLAAAMGTVPGHFQQRAVEGEQHALLWGQWRQKEE